MSHQITNHFAIQSGANPSWFYVRETNSFPLPFTYEIAMCDKNCPIIAFVNMNKIIEITKKYVSLFTRLQHERRVNHALDIWTMCQNECRELHQELQKCVNDKDLFVGLPHKNGFLQTSQNIDYAKMKGMSAIYVENFDAFLEIVRRIPAIQSGADFFVATIELVRLIISHTATNTKVSNVARIQNVILLN